LTVTLLPKNHPNPYRPFRRLSTIQKAFFRRPLSRSVRSKAAVVYFQGLAIVTGNFAHIAVDYQTRRLVGFFDLIVIFRMGWHIRLSSE
jgi:hypothetical protein